MPRFTPLAVGLAAVLALAAPTAAEAKPKPKPTTIEILKVTTDSMRVKIKNCPLDLAPAASDLYLIAGVRQADGSSEFRPDDTFSCMGRHTVVVEFPLDSDSDPIAAGRGTAYVTLYSFDYEDDEGDGYGVNVSTRESVKIKR